jgi:hypothetical protein
MPATARFPLQFFSCCVLLSACATSPMVTPRHDRMLFVDGAAVAINGSPTLLEVLRGATYIARLGGETVVADPPLVLIDGITQTSGSRALAAIQAIDVDSVVTIRGTRAAALYGPKARSGAIVVHTRKTSVRGGPTAPGAY